MHLILMSRIRQITFCIVGAFSALAGYLLHLQVYQNDFFLQLSRRNFVRHEEIDSPRGNITDQHTALLATNRPVYDVYWQGTGRYKLTPEQEQLLTLITIICPLDDQLIDEVAQAERRSYPVRLATDIPYELLTKIVEQVPSTKNIVINKRYERHYPHNNLACHIVGYLGMKDALGKMGLERLYNEKLTGQSGKILKIINSLGRKVKAHRLSPATFGATVHTTLDLSLQQLAEQLFPKDYDGCFLLMDDEGALEVVLSRPSFSPELFLQPLSYEQWALLQKNNRFINRAFGACYPPASLFKLVTLAAALETGLITPETTWDCRGYTPFKGRNYHCNRRWGHGIIGTEWAFAQSCNIPFYEIGKVISIDTLADYANRLGLGAPTGILFPEQKGLVPTTTWKRKARNEPWWPGETLSAVIGQSSLLVTPLQIACMITAVCTGYRVKPRILTEEPINQEPVNLRAETLSFLQTCLTAVIKQGTGASLKGLEGFTIQGKSGTAQVRSRTRPATSKKDLCHGYFTARFQYGNHKPRTLVILLEHAGSSRHAVNLARQFLEQVALLKK